jgi:hypothetical protein
MYSPTEAEIIGIGFGSDEYPSSYHTDFTLYSNGSGPLNKDPYIPIEQEEMGRNWDSNEYNSSDPNAVRPYDYYNIYDTKDPMRVNDYYLDRKEHLMTNFPTFHATEPFISNNKSDIFMIFVILMFIILIVIAIFQNFRINKMYRINKKLKRIISNN